MLAAKLGTAERLRELAAQMLALADELDNAAPEVPAPASSALVPLRQAAGELGMTYDAVRKAAKRANKNVNVGGQSYVWRDWVGARLSALSGLSGVLPDRCSIVHDSKHDDERTAQS